jgi:hypothetical protein
MSSDPVRHGRNDPPARGTRPDPQAPPGKLQPDCSSLLRSKPAPPGILRVAHRQSRWRAATRVGDVIRTPNIVRRHLWDATEIDLCVSRCGAVGGARYWGGGTVVQRRRLPTHRCPAIPEMFPDACGGRSAPAHRSTETPSPRPLRQRCRLGGRSNEGNLAARLIAPQSGAGYRDEQKRQMLGHSAHGCLLCGEAAI